MLYAEVSGVTVDVSFPSSSSWQHITVRYDGQGECVVKECTKGICSYNLDKINYLFFIILIIETFPLIYFSFINPLTTRIFTVFFYLFIFIKVY